MARIDIVSLVYNKTLFSLDIEPNSLKTTLAAGVHEGADLRGADLRGADLRGAPLQGAALRGANLQGADLQGADLRGADLRGADLQGANLQGADLQGANLQYANLQSANLQYAALQGTNLQGTNLQGTNLQGTNLQYADLRGANLRGADLRGADLRGAKNAAVALAQTSIVPECGAFQGFKQLREGKIAHVSIPAEAQRSSATGRICRAEYVDTLAIYDKDGEPCTSGVSLYNAACLYHVGARVTCDAWESDRWQECGGGIHFYLTRIEAEHYA